MRKGHIKVYRVLVYEGDPEWIRNTLLNAQVAPVGGRKIAETGWAIWSYLDAKGVELLGPRIDPSAEARMKYVMHMEDEP